MRANVGMGSMESTGDWAGEASNRSSGSGWSQVFQDAFRVGVDVFHDQFGGYDRMPAGMYAQSSDGSYQYRMPNQSSNVGFSSMPGLPGMGGAGLGGSSLLLIGGGVLLLMVVMGGRK